MTDSDCTVTMYRFAGLLTLKLPSKEVAELYMNTVELEVTAARECGEDDYLHDLTLTRHDFYVMHSATDAKELRAAVGLWVQATPGGYTLLWNEADFG